MTQLIYADNAATTKLDIDAFEAMKPYLLEYYGNASQPYLFSQSVKTALKRSRQKIAACINAEPEEIYFTSGGTESDNWAIKGSAFSDTSLKYTITSQIEHHAILNACAAIEKLQYPVVYLRVSKNGVITPTELKAQINQKTRIVSVMLANNEIGVIQPVKELCSIAHAHGAIFHTDAVQALGHVIVNVRELEVDMLSASAHKFNGPKGIGFLFIRKGTTIMPYIDGGAQEHGLRAGTENIASIVGMAVALQKNCEEIEANTMHLEELDAIIIKTLCKSGIDYRRNGSCNRVPGNISLSFKNIDGEALLHRLDLMGICVSTGSACDTVNTQISHVLHAIGLPIGYAQGTIRITLGKENTKEEAEAIAKAILRVILYRA